MTASRFHQTSGNTLNRVSASYDLWRLANPTNHLLYTPLHFTPLSENFPLVSSTADHDVYDASQCRTIRKHAHAIYRKCLVVKMKNFTGKILIFFLFLLKTYIVGTR